MKNCRIYNECEITPVQAFYSELEIYFNQCIDEGYNIYVFNNKPIHKIIFSKNDINYISLNPYSHKKEAPDYYFSENLKYIKENQLKDYRWFLCDNQFDFIFFIPYLNKNNKYYFNFIVGVKNKEKISNIINHKFNLIELDNFQCLNQIVFDMQFLKKIFKIKNIENENIETTLFRDNLLIDAEWDLCRNKKGRDFPFTKYINFCLKKICFHFYYDKSIEKIYAFTDFLELVNGVAAYNNEKNLKIESTPYPVPFLDLIDHNNEILFFFSWEIEKFRQNEIDWERNYLYFCIEEIKNFDWDDPNKELLNWKKNAVEKFKIRLKEYRRLLKNSKKK